MWAMIPIFRYLSSGNSRAIREIYPISNEVCRRTRLDAVVRESAVGFSHLVSLITLADGGTGLIKSIDQFGGELVGERLAGALMGGRKDPADGQRGAAVGGDFHRDLVGGATHTARTDFHCRAHVAQGGVEDLDGALLGALFDHAHGIVNQGGGGALLAALEDVLDHGLQVDAVIADVGKDFPSFGFGSAHGSIP